MSNDYIGDTDADSGGDIRTPDARGTLCGHPPATGGTGAGNVKKTYTTASKRRQSPALFCCPRRPTTAPPTTLPADSTHVGIPQYGGWSGFGGMGSVKSIEITTEKTEDRSSITAADSVVQQKAQSEETRQRERASEARHDNGTVIGLAIVAAAAIIVIIRILIKIYLKK